MSELRDKAVVGISWSLTGQFLRMPLALAIGIALARLLTPHDFGLMAMIVVLTGYADLFSTFGFGAALIQAQNLHKKHYSSVFWVNIVTGFSLTILFVFAAPWISQFYEEPDLVPIIRFMALATSIKAISVVPWCLLARELRFKSLAIVEVSSVLTGGAVAVVMATLGFGVWCLVAQGIISAILSTVLLWSLGRWRPTFSFSHRAIKDLFGFSANVFGDMFLGYAARSVDSLLIGKFFGASALGPYNRTYNLMLVPVVNFANVLARVVFPALSTIQDDKQRVRSAVLRGTGVIALVTFPIMMGLLVTADTVVVVVFGAKWIEMVPFLGAFCFAGMMLAATSLLKSLYMSQGRADLQFRVGAVTKVGHILGMVVGLQWGPIGVAYGYLAALCITSYPEVHFAGRLVGFDYMGFLRVLVGPLACSVAMAAVVQVSETMIPADAASWKQLAVAIALGITTYGLLVHVARLSSYKELRSIVSRYWKKNGKVDCAVSSQPLTRK